MPTVTLVRHGQKEPSAGDPGLTEVGIQQARETGLYLRQFPVTEIISSPYKRTIQTAEQIAEVLSLHHSLHESLRERMNWSDPTTPFPEFLAEWVKATNDRTYVPQHGQSSLQTGQKIEQLIAERIQKDSHLVLVSHGGAILDYVRNLIDESELAGLRTHYASGEDYQVMNCSVTQLELGPPVKLQLLNFTDHLSHLTE